MNSLVSIIIPCYNISPYLPRCLDSILSQTYTNFELLLLNDGSTDSTLEICKSYAARDNRIRLFTHENKGVSFTRNRGIREASGELIFFVDGDDCIKQNFIQRHIDSFQEGVLVISGFENNSDRMQSHAFVKLLEQYKNKDISIQNILKVLKYDSLNSPCCRLFERDILIKNNVFFNELLSYQEDIVFNLSYCKFIDSIRPIDFLGYYYINNPNSSSSKFHKNLNYTENLFQELSLFIIDEDDHNSISKFIFETLFFKISNIFHQNTEFTIKNRLKYLDEVIKSPYYKMGLQSIKEMQLNMFLRILLTSRNVFLIFFYFNTRFYLTKFKTFY